MAGWAELCADLQRIAAQAPGAVVGRPDLSGPPPPPPWWVSLAAWAVDIAAGLNTEYGELLDLSVGALTYPGGLGTSRLTPRFELPTRFADSIGLDVLPTRDLVVSSGHNRRVDVDITNRGSVVRRLETNGSLMSWVVDSSDRVVGGFCGAQAMPMIGFTVHPGESIVVPVSVGAAALAPGNGYVVPPGQWHLVVMITARSELHTTTDWVRTPTLALTVSV